MTEQVVDPAVTRAKFDRELADFRARQGMFRARGWWLLSAEFPVIEIAFATPNCPLPFVALAARIDFTNYDLWPPSVTLIEPFSGRPLATIDQVNAPMARATPTGILRLVQAHVGKPPFICLPGVREYHQHPAHDGDDWLLHRGRGAGGLFFLVDKLSHYGSETINGYEIGINVKPTQGIVPQ